MVVDARRVRHEDGADPHRGELRHGEGAGTADHQVRPPIRLAHVLDERAHVGPHPRLGVAPAPGVDPALARLVAHVEGERAGEALERERHDRIQPCRALTAADHEDPHRSRAPGEARRRRRQRADIGPHGIADDARVDVAAEAAREALEHLPREMREDAVGEAGDGVLLVDQERPAREPGGKSPRSRHEAPETHHDDRAVAPHDTQRLDQREGQPYGRTDPGEDPLAAQPPHREPLERDAFRRNDPRLESARGSEPDDLELLPAQQPRQRQRREYMSTGAAGHDEDRPAHAARLAVAEPRCSRVAS